MADDKIAELIKALAEARECLEGDRPYTVSFGLYLTRLLRELGELA